MIVEAREAGLSVSDLQSVFHHTESGEEGTVDAEQFFDGKIAEVKAVIANARRFLTVLTRARAALQPPVGAGISKEEKRKT